MFHSYADVIRKYAQFTGRSRRKEFWGFALVNILISVVFSILIGAVGIDRDTNEYTLIGWVLVALIVLYGLFILVPNIALQWRRYQDIGWAGPVSIVGWFVPLLTLIVAFIPGNVGGNDYGPDPKA
ncbi:DUF805 domain-containing protein [Demequina lignilytica]|uniref:DUF805 domain-containing protein n=1 Tax=Demequina lignilytica TaxID=3051663 RepID=A0AAW7M7M9_9MICO|nr:MULTISPECIES: DUF805 domain-containing protein [unclassified Demequina]MDN4477834.1 DUF805 domain-containing protein [Demequina sp. SYSU T00039-1]MDN4483473.1 DUF805 domain-containing protein [Demequina sp. SYSU T0a273]MDN4487743.1 DUF805 domain-containing protein [Demequina sp. SYSU T00039]MDN4490874.1 DUF805 domain-containing protein [Demequina sp. SYSU T00068]